MGHVDLGFGRHLAAAPLGGFGQYSLSAVGVVCHGFAAQHHLAEPLTVHLSVYALGLARLTNKNRL